MEVFWSADLIRLNENRILELMFGVMVETLYFRIRITGLSLNARDSNEDIRLDKLCQRLIPKALWTISCHYMDSALCVV